MLTACLALTIHLGIGPGWNDIHPCVRYEEGPVAVGVYLNSMYEVSTYLTYTYGDEWFIEGGFVTGYFTPVMVRAGHKVDDVIYFVSPAWSDYEGGSVGVVLGIERRF